MGFWKNVNDDLKFKNLSRKELAFKSGIPQTTIDKGIERDSDVSALTGLKISKALDVSLEFLLDIETAEDEKEIKCKNKLKNNRQNRLTEKYKTLIENMEKLPESTKEKLEELIINLASEKK